MPGGRPPLFETPEQLDEAIEDYFKKCVPEPVMYSNSDGDQEPVRDSRGNPVFIQHPPTTAGLALHLGYASRQSLYDQPGRSEEFSYIIKKAITRIENIHEQNLSSSGSPVGSIFWLKNHQWADKTEMGLTGPNGGPILTHGLSSAEAEEFQRRMNEMHSELSQDDRDRS